MSNDGKLALDSLPWRRKHVFTGAKENTQLALSSSKFLHFCLIRVWKAETVFALRLWHRNTTPQCSVMVRQGTEIYFLSSFSAPALIGPLPPLGGGLREELSQQRGACPEGGLRRCLSWPSAPGGPGEPRQLTQRKSMEPWCIMWIFNVCLQQKKAGMDRPGS